MESVCNALVYQDQNDRCVLDRGHVGEHKPAKKAYELTVRPYRRKVESYEDDPYFCEVSRGDGISCVVPRWIAERLAEVGLGDSPRKENA